jgi:hypothetical protein
MKTKFVSATAGLALSLTGAMALTVGFDDLPNPPAVSATTGLQYATTPGDGSSYEGVLWDANVEIVGAQYRVDSVTPGPLFGLPHSGKYYITNGGGAQGVSLGTTLVLTGAWFGRNQYYGFGGGADQITINALHNGTTLASVTYDLPLTNPGQPEPLTFVDTSSFEGLSGITGYTIDHYAPAEFADNWVADDFTFAPAAVPEPGAAALATGIVALGFAAGRRCRR